MMEAPPLVIQEKLGLVDSGNPDGSSSSTVQTACSIGSADNTHLSGTQPTLRVREMHTV